MYFGSKLRGECWSYWSQGLLISMILILFTRTSFAVETALNENFSVRNTSMQDYNTYDSVHKADQRAKVTACPTIKRMNDNEFSLQKISRKHSAEIISDFTLRFSLSIVLGQCLHFPAWLRGLKCTKDLHVYIYLKCQTTIEEVISKFSREIYYCIQPISLNAPIYSGQQGTIKHFLHENYYNLTDYLVFLKDNGRKSVGVPILTRVASALVNSEKSSEGVRFMTLSDVPPAYQAKIRKHTSKSRSVRASIADSIDIGSDIMRQDPNSTVSKYCAMFEKFTCSSCRRVWIPVRSQFLVSRETISAVDIEEFNISTSMHGEYTWALLFDCFVEKLSTRKSNNEIVYPFIVCVR